MKTALYLVVVVAAFALVQESAGAGLREKRNVWEDTMNNLNKKVEALKEKLKEIVQKVRDFVADKLQNFGEELFKNLDKVDGDTTALKEKTQDNLKALYADFLDKLKTGVDVEEHLQELHNKLKELVDYVGERAQIDTKTAQENLVKFINDIKAKITETDGSIDLETNLTVN